MYSPLYKAESKNPKTRVADANNTIIIRTIKQGIPTNKPLPDPVYRQPLSP